MVDVTTAAASQDAAAPVADFAIPHLPPGRPVHLPGRGTPFVRVAEGPENAPTLVLLHGWTATSDLNWFTSYRTLSQQYTVVSFDHRGHGRGIRTPDRFRLADCADDAVAVADALGVEKIIPVGYSMGGPVAQLVAHRHPDRVEGLVLCATSRNFSGGRSDRLWTSVMTGLSWAARGMPAKARTRLTHRLVDSRKVDDAELAEWAATELRRNDVRMLAEAGAAIGRFTSHEWIGDIDVPSAVVVTLRDRVVPTHRQLKLADALPGATRHLVDGEHSACVLQPEAFREALVEALDSVATRR
jgi:3-oxoadipate enol-lactonase